MIDCDYLIIAHRWYQPDGSVKFGGIDRTKDHLLAAGYRVALMEHPLTTVDVDYELPKESRLSILEGSERNLLDEFTVRPSSNPWRWLVEGRATVASVAKHLKPGFAVLSADPLAGLAGLKLRRKGLAKSTLLHFTDYAEKRTSNPVLNAAYRWICRKNLAGNDIVLCVSKRMIESFKVIAPNGKYMFFPNTPSLAECPTTPAAERSRKSLVLLGVDANGMQHEMLVSALAKIRKTGAEVYLDVIGGGGGEVILSELAEKAGIPDVIHSFGFMPREVALNTASTARMGVVLYDRSVPWNHWRDSIKIREYAACGIPIVCDDSTGTAEDAAAAGCAELVRTVDGLADAVTRLLSDEDHHSTMSASALAWAEQNDKQKYLDELMEKIR